jgi:hypothetical protein
LPIYLYVVSARKRKKEYRRKEERTGPLPWTRKKLKMGRQLGNYLNFLGK